MVYRDLLKLGLSDNESKIYVAYLKEGKSTAASIARNISMDKSSAYRAVESLEELGLLIKYPKQRGTTYEAANPEVLKSLLRRKREEVELQSKNIDEFITSYYKQVGDSKRNTYITMEKGYDAHIESMEKSLEENPEGLIREIWDLDNPIFNQKEYSEYVGEFIKRRLEKGIKVKYLARFRENEPYNEHMIPSKEYLKEIRLMPEGFTNSSGLRIWSDMIEIVSFDENGDHVVITAKDKFLTELIKNMYDFIWERSEEYSSPLVEN